MERIPDERDWGDWQADHDQRWAHEVLFGLSSEEAQKTFASMNPVDAGEALHFIDPTPFMFYMKAFAEHVASLRDYPSSDASDAANVFLDLVLGVLRADPHRILPILRDILPVVRTVSSAQEQYGAPADIYESFEARGREISRQSEELLKDVTV